MACLSEISFCQSLAPVDEFSCNKTCVFWRQTNQVDSFVYRIRCFLGDVCSFFGSFFFVYCVSPFYIWLASRLRIRFFVFKLSLARANASAFMGPGVRSFVHRCTPGVLAGPWRNGSPPGSPKRFTLKNSPRPLRTVSISFFQYVIGTKDVGLEVEGAERSNEFVARFSARDRRI